MSVDWLLEPFLLGFQQRALIGGLIAAVMTSMVGVWIVLRGMSFFGDAFVHGVMPGISAAILFDFSPYLGAALAAIVMVSLMEFVHRQTQLKEDTAIGLLFVGMMALGVVIISMSRSYTGSLTGILFGDILGVGWGDIAAQGAIAVVVIALSIVLYRPLLALSISAPKAQTLGMAPKLTHALLLVMIAGAVIGSFQSVGTMLVFALLVGPPATAAILVRTVRQMIAVSLVLSCLAVWAGLVISFHLGTAGSATMALLCIVIFFVVLVVRTIARTVRRVRAEAVPA